MSNKNNEFIEFCIKPDGTVEIELEGFHGQGCAEVASEMIKKLGKSSDKKRKPEYYQEEKQQQCQRKTV